MNESFLSLNKIFSFCGDDPSLEVEGGYRLMTKTWSPYEEKPVYAAAKSFYLFALGFSNCLYLVFDKKDFPKFVYPPAGSDGEVSISEMEDSIFAGLPFHGGITFTEYDSIFPGSVMIGCDYAHAGDDVWMSGRFHEELLEEPARELSKAFMELYATL